MTLLIVLITLLVDRVLWNPDPYRNRSWLEAFPGWLAAGPAGTWVTASSIGPILVLLPPVLLVWWVQELTRGGWSGSLEFAFGLLVLLFSFGPTDLGRETDEFLASRESADEGNTNRLARFLCRREIPGDEPVRSLQVASSVLIEANSRIFGPLFWFILLGPMGAALYRLACITAHWFSGKDIDSSARSMVRRLDFLLNWIPARLTILGYATAGNFEAVAQVWKNFHSFSNDQHKNEAAMLLEAAGTAALDTYPSRDELDGSFDLPPVVEDAMALVWRTLSLWVAILAVASFIGWMS